MKSAVKPTSVHHQAKDGERHHNCTHCNANLNGKKYVLRKELPICLACFMEKYADRCHTCLKPIGFDTKEIIYKNSHWHEECFQCSKCKKSLVSVQFQDNAEGIFCTDCHDLNFAERCDKCSDTIKWGTQKFDYGGKRYHYACFRCYFCKKPIGGESFVKNEEEWACTLCYNEHFAQKCTKCAKVLLSSGVSFRDGAFHTECFTCTKCHCELGNATFATKNDDPFCRDCYTDMFCRLCEKCGQHIGVFGVATKFVGFDWRHWHAECFGCYACKKNLAGNAFVMSNGDVLCPDCGKFN